MLELQTVEDVSSVPPHYDVPGLATDDMECKICYSPYNLESRRPKVLECCHRLCSKCLVKILELGELGELGESSPDALVCPFCRYVTRFFGEAARNLPDDCNLVAKLALRAPCRNQKNLLTRRDSAAELLLSPGRLNALMAAGPPSAPSASSAIRSSPHFVVITIVEPPPASSPGQDLRAVRTCRLDRDSSSLGSLGSAPPGRTSARVLVWLLGLLYFSSLPMGVYLLVVQRSAAGVLLVSLVPGSLVVILLYGFCRCVCYEFCRCFPP